MKRISIILLLFVTICYMSAQNKKILTNINSIISQEQIEFKYDSKGQLKSLTEKGKTALREFSFKYDKDNRLVECNINRDKGSIIRNSKYSFIDNKTIKETVIEKGRMLNSILEDAETLYLDDKGLLARILFDNGDIWEQFSYDNNENLIHYTYNSTTLRGTSETTLKYDNNKSPLSIVSLPKWFWAHILNNTKRCFDFIGTNNAIESFTKDLYKDDTKIAISYQYDKEGYPVKQFYNGELVRELIYK